MSHYCRLKTFFQGSLGIVSGDIRNRRVFLTMDVGASEFNTTNGNPSTRQQLHVNGTVNRLYKPIRYSEEYTVAITTLYVVIMFVSIFGYSLIFLAFYLNSRLRTICNYFILSLGIADTLILCSVLPTSIYMILVEDANPYGNSIVWCDFFATLNLIGTSAVALNLSSLSVERFLAMAYPFSYELFMTRKKALALIAGLWAYSAVTGLLPQMGWRNRETTVISGRCVRDTVRSYVFFLVILNFCVPAVVMIASNIGIFFIAREQVKKILKSTPQPAENLLVSEKKGKRLKSDKFKMNVRAARRVSVIVGAFLLCWLPHIVVIIVGLAIGHHKIPYEVYPVTLSLEYMSSAIDPCIFCFTNRDLRNALKSFFRKLFSRKACTDLTDASLFQNRRVVFRHETNGGSVDFELT